jgi:apolipoprotein D and lipocalin family protein
MKLTRASLILVIALTVFTTGCQSIPEKAEAIKPFNVDKYLGTWYEIARIDFSSEEGLNNVTANYSLNDDGTIKVLNRGWDFAKGEWKQAEGKAKFRGARNEGALKVSFFGPFYSGYNILAIGADYEYAMVAGKDLDYLWLLSRTPTMPDEMKAAFLNQAKKVGYDTNRLLWVEHDKNK